MKISELIQKLTEAQNAHGDLLVTIGITDEEGEYADAVVGDCVIVERCFTIETADATFVREGQEGDRHDNL